MLFLGAYGILLSAAAGKKELLVGTPVAGRNQRQLQEICGPFISTMPLRLRVDAEEETGRYLQQIRQEVTGMLEHPDCSLEEMISDVYKRQPLSPDSHPAGNLCPVLHGAGELHLCLLYTSCLFRAIL